MQLIDTHFPLLIGVAPRRYDADAVRRMAEAFEPHFQRGRKYAYLSLQPEDSVTPDARERKLVLDWVTSPRVREHSRTLCVGSSAIVPNILLRGALTAVLWFWKTPFPFSCFPTSSGAVEYCVQQLVHASVPLPYPQTRFESLVKSQVDTIFRREDSKEGPCEREIGRNLRPSRSVSARFASSRPAPPSG